MNNRVILPMVVFIPFAGAFFLPLAGKFSQKARNILAISLAAVPFVLLLTLLPALFSGVSLAYTIKLPLGFSFGFLADGLAVFMGLISSFLGIVVAVYSLGYIKHDDNQNEYYLFVVLFIGAMMGIVLSTDLLFLYGFWEVSAVCCWRLIGFYREREYIRRANKAFLITMAGAVLMLAGFITIYMQYGTTDLTTLHGKSISDTAVILILLGIFAKSATLPLHSWLADAGIAPSPVTALLHAAVLVKIGVYAFARLFLVTFVINDIWHTAVPVIAAISALVSAGAAIAENDIKRIVAYSTVSQIAFIFLGLSVGGWLAAAGGLLYIFMHGFSKAGLFLCAGIIEHNCHTKDIRKMGGLYRTMPVTAVSFFLCSASVMGLPPFGGFFSKYMVITGTAYAGQPWLAFVFVLGAILTVVYLMRTFLIVFLGEPKTENTGYKEGSQSMLLSVAFLAGLSLISGLLVYYPSEFVNLIIKQMGAIMK